MIIKAADYSEIKVYLYLPCNFQSEVQAVILLSGIYSLIPSGCSYLKIFFPLHGSLLVI